MDMLSDNVNIHVLLGNETQTLFGEKWQIPLSGRLVTTKLIPVLTQEEIRSKKGKLRTLPKKMKLLESMEIFA